MKRALTLVLLVATCVAQHKPAKNTWQGPEASLFPMTKGTSWTYRAHVKNANGASDLHWSVAIIDSVDTPDYSAALLRGGPWDLAWYRPNVQPGTHVVVRVADTYYLLHDDGRDIFASMKAGTVPDLQDRLSDDVWFRAPLHEGDTFCPPESSGQPPMYCWAVDSVAKSQTLKIGKVAIQGADVYQLIFRTNPDHEIVTFVPGVGITAWEYVHHGTLSEAKLQLVEYRVGK